MNRTVKVLSCIISVFLLSVSLVAKMPISFRKGELAFHEGRYQEALDLYKNAEKNSGLNPREVARIRWGKARAYIGLKEWNNAENEVDWVLKNIREPQSLARAKELKKIIAAPEDPNVTTYNLGSEVNSRYEELAPVIAPDGKTLYFIVDGNPKGYGKQDIYFSEIQQDGKWGEAVAIKPPLNTEGHDGILSISPDGTTALLAGVYDSHGQKRTGYSIAHKSGYRWMDPEKLEIHDYYNNNALTSANMSSNGKVLLLALERKDSFGDLDLYVCFLNPDETWTAPLNLGKEVNTRGTDGTPFLAGDNKTLYFSSDGRTGLGDQDMYVTRRLDDTWTRWSKPVNMGKQINSPGWDAYYTIPAKGDVAYFVSSADGGYGLSDIWAVTLPEEVRPGAVVTVSGKVMEPDSTPVGTRISWERLSDAKNMGYANSDDVTGDYMIVLPVGESFGYVAQKDGYLPASAHLDLTDVEAYQEVHHDIIITPIEKGAQTTLKNIFFDFDQATLRQESMGELNRVKNFLLEHPTITVEIAGHTDSVGTESYNKKLSKDRAQAVADWFILNGIESSRLQPVGYGESEPIADNNSEEGRSKNRRVVFEILDL